MNADMKADVKTTPVARAGARSARKCAQAKADRPGPKSQAAVPSAATLRRRLKSMGALLRGMPAAFEGIDPQQAVRLAHLATIGAMVEMLAGGGRGLPTSGLIQMARTTADPQWGAGRGVKRGRREDVPRDAEGHVQWPPEFPEIVRRNYGVHVFDPPHERGRAEDARKESDTGG
jgi:hypothetical protein